MAGRLKNRVAIITGGSMGIGKATALLFAKEGAKVVVASRTAELLKQVVASISSAGGEALAVPTDVTKREEVEGLARETVERFGRIDILVNNAGRGLHAAVIDLTPQALQQVFELNVFAPLTCIQAVYPYMKRQGGGQIINVSSIVGLRSIPTITGYCMSKYALNALSDGLRIEAKQDHIDVLTVYPAKTQTEFASNQQVIGKRHAHPDWFIQNADIVARAILKASLHRRRDTILTWSARMMKRVNDLAPSLMDKILHAGYQRARKEE